MEALPGRHCRAVGPGGKTARERQQEGGRGLNSIGASIRSGLPLTDAQVLHVAEHSVMVHYISWSDRWNEWIDKDAGASPPQTNPTAADGRGGGGGAGMEAADGQV